MNRPAVDRAVMLALAALYEVTTKVGPDPYEPTLELRALLAALHFISNGDRGPYDRYWRQAMLPRKEEYDSAAKYIRATYMRTHWTGIVRTLGVEPQRMDFHSAINEIIAKQRERVDPAWALIRAAQAVRDGAASREIIASKGHPRTAPARMLMEERIARGEEPA